jgi:hypothetical protein
VPSSPVFGRPSLALSQLSFASFRIVSFRFVSFLRWDVRLALRLLDALAGHDGPFWPRYAALLPGGGGGAAADAPDAPGAGDDHDPAAALAMPQLLRERDLRRLGHAEMRDAAAAQRARLRRLFAGADEAEGAAGEGAGGGGEEEVEGLETISSSAIRR